MGPTNPTSNPDPRHLVAVTSDTYEQLRYGFPNLRTFVSLMAGWRHIPKPEELGQSGVREVDTEALLREVHAVGEMLGSVSAPGYPLWDIVECAEKFLADLKTRDRDERASKIFPEKSTQTDVERLQNENLALKMRVSSLNALRQSISVDGGRRDL